jgi:hypothetical protein
MMTLREVISRLRALRTMHADTMPAAGPLRENWKAERAAIEQLERQMLERLNAQREARA